MRGAQYRLTTKIMTSHCMCSGFAFAVTKFVTTKKSRKFQELREQL